MKNVFNWKKTLAALCVLALLVSVLPASVLAEEMVEIPESDYIYVNEDSRIVTAQEEMSLLRLTVETAGKFHVLASGVDIKLVLFDETAGTVRDVYSSENGLMDVPFYAAPGMYLLGIIGSGEVAIRVADEAETEKIYSAEVVAEEPAKEEVTEESAEEAAEETPAEQPAAEPVVEEPAFDPSVPISYKGVIGETVSVLAILQEAGAPVEAVTYVAGNVDGILVSSADSVNLGNWLLTPCGYFDSVTLIVKTVEDVDYTLVVSCPAPVEEVEPAEAPAEIAAEQPADTTVEVVDEQPADTSAEVTDVPPAETVADEQVEEPEDEVPEDEVKPETEETAEEPETQEPENEQPEEASEEESEKEEKGFLAGFVDWLTGSSDKDKEEAESDETAEDDEAADESAEVADTDEPAEEASDDKETIEEVEKTEETAEEPEEEAAEEEVTEAIEEEKETEESSDESLLTTNYSLPIDSVTIAVERGEDAEIRLFAEDIGEEDAEAYAYQWQYSLDGEEWFDVEGATEKDYTFKLDETNGSYYWRLVVSYT